MDTNEDCDTIGNEYINNINVNTNNDVTLHTTTMNNAQTPDVNDNILSNTQLAVGDGIPGPVIRPKYAS